MRDSQETKKKSTVKAIGLPVLFAFLVALAVGSVSYVFVGKDKPFLVFTTLPADSTLDISLTRNGKTIALAPQDDDKIYLDRENLQSSYTLMMVIEDRARNQFRDITISYRSDTNLAAITADGFSSADTVMIAGNEELHFDWSGKIELSVPALPENSDTCLETSAGISFCHALPERTGA